MKKITTLIILCFCLAINGQTTYVETFDNLTRYVGKDASPESTVGTSGITYERGPALGLNGAADPTSRKINIRTAGGVRAYVEFTLENGFTALSFKYQRAWNFNTSKPTTFTLKIGSESEVTITQDPEGADNIVDTYTYSGAAVTESVKVRLTHNGSDMGVFVDDFTWTEAAPLGVEDLFSKVAVYPNPVKDFLYLENQNSLNLTSFEVIDLTGKRIQKGDFSSDNKIFLGKLNAGLYVLQISTDSGNTITKKIIKN